MNQVLLTVFYLSLWAIVIFCIYVPFVWLTEHWNRIGQGLAFLTLCAAKIALVYVWFVTGPDWLYLPGFLMLLPEASCIFHYLPFSLDSRATVPTSLCLRGSDECCSCFGFSYSVEGNPGIPRRLE